MGYTVKLNPAAVIYKLPEQISWQPVTPAGNQNAVLVCDPDKPGFYIVLTKWIAGVHFSRPHFHPNDRFITVLKGTWWVGTGTKFDTINTVPLPPGSFATHFAKQVHYDGAKFEDAILLITGNGPATSVLAEEKWAVSSSASARDVQMKLPRRAFPHLTAGAAALCLAGSWEQAYPAWTMRRSNSHRM